MPTLSPNSASLDTIMETLGAIAHGRHEPTHAMPGAFYTSPEFLDLERERVFRRQWVCIGHTGEIPSPGDYFATELIDEPLLVQRDAQGKVHVLVNVCRHRGNIVASGRGNKRVHVCGYHAWSYDLEGLLKRAPMMQDCAHLDPSSCRLPVIRTEIWQNFIFVNLSGDAAPLAPSIAPLEGHIRNFHNEERHLYHSREEVWDTNWKCLAENFMEAYHLNATHPRTLRPVTPTELCEYLPGNGHFSAYRAHYTPDAPQRRPHHPDLNEHEQRFSFLFSIFPSFVVTFMPHQTIYLCLSPLSVGRVAIRWGIAGHDPAPDPTELARHIAFADAFNAEDRTKLETLQRGLKSRFYVPGPLAAMNYEGTLRDFYKFMARSVCD